MAEFKFIGCIEVKELLGLKADNEAQLLEWIEEVDLDSIYYHMHSYFLRHVYLSGPYPNDFANWAAIELRDRVLGEKACAYVVPQAGQEFGFEEMILFLRTHKIASYKLPERLEVRSELPLVAEQKVDKKLLETEIAQKLEIERG